MTKLIKTHRNKLIIIFHHFALLYGLISYGFQWEYVLMSIASGYIMFALFAHFAHLYFSHKKFEGKWYDIVYAFMVNSTTAIGGVYNFTVLHRHHHKFADTEKDPHSPSVIGALRVYTLMWNNVKVNPVQSRDVAKHKSMQFLHHHQVKLHFLSTFILFLINPILVFFIISPSVVYTFHVNGLVNWRGHLNGVPRNIPEIAWLTPLSWRHGDHHNH
jgi:stearoyl-CoA desaturase (delta-9 desaturase)